MKILTIFALIILCFSGYCQNVKYDMKEVPKQTNRINIANSKTSEENYNYVGKILVQNGYGLKTSNKEFGQFETAPKQMNRKQGWTGMFNIVVSDNSISVTGQVTSGVSMGFGSGVRTESSYYPIKYLGKGLFDNSAFFEMMDLSFKFGDNLKYAIQ